MTQTTTPYGSWRSPITSDLIVAESIALNDVLLSGDAVYWIEGRPHEGGRYVLVERTPEGQVSDVTPPKFNVRTRVHEYGGGAAVVHAGTVYFSNFADQRLYRQPVGGKPVPLTPEPQDPERTLRYADGVIDPGRKRWIGVREDHTVEGREAVNTIVAVDLAKGGPGTVLVEGNDFYSSPRLDPDRKRLAWLTWNHPNMPWNGTELWVTDITDTGSLTNQALVAGGPSESIFQPEWSPDGVLHFVSDRSGWWNLYRQEGTEAVALCPKEAEFGLPQWLFGLSTYAFLSPRRLVCSHLEGGLGKLAILDVQTRSLTPLFLPWTSYNFVRANQSRVVFRAGAPTEPASVVMLNPKTKRTTVLRRATAVADAPAVNRCLSKPQPIEFPTENGKTAHALYYPPFNPDFAAPSKEKPPLVVKCHGGPTGMTGSTLDLKIQFWTSRGIGVVDVNYGGSTGFGRDYRERLRLQWGVIDVDDCVNAAKHLVKQGQADANRCVITGGSAGGYTVLACLAFRDFFKGGASHYGVSDLEALARDTHKFESRYNDWLLGALPKAKKLWRERSPVCHADRLNAPVIFFQGDEDRVVPPNQAEVMVEALRKKGIPVAYLLFGGEQHGFRKAENIKRALDAELYFYAALVWKVGLAF